MLRLILKNTSSPVELTTWTNSFKGEGTRDNGLLNKTKEREDQAKRGRLKSVYRSHYNRGASIASSPDDALTHLDVDGTVGILDFGLPGWVRVLVLGICVRHFGICEICLRLWVNGVREVVERLVSRRAWRFRERLWCWKGLGLPNFEDEVRIARAYVSRFQNISISLLG